MKFLREEHEDVSVMPVKDEYHNLDLIYKNKRVFKDKDSESNDILDFLNKLKSENKSFEEYTHKKDNGLTIFYESFDDEETSKYKYVSSKSVEDSDGFMTDYTWYKSEDGTNVFVFGDNEIYTPEDGYFDFETDNDWEAQQWFDSYNGFSDEFIDESWRSPKYDESEWEPEDIELHKSIDWAARNYEEYPVVDDTIVARATAYGLPGGTQQKNVTFVKHLRPNEIYPPYYKAEEIPFEGVLSGMYDGDKHGKYMIMNRFETQDVYDSLSEDADAHLKLSGNMIEIPIEDNSEVGELGHPVQQGIGDPRAKREKNLEEATAVLDKPLSTFQGTLSSVLLAHKDEVDTLFDRNAAVEFLDRIQPEVKSRAYVDKVKQDILKSRRNPVEYFYNIILKGDGDGTEKGGVVTKKSQVRRWAKEDLTESLWEKGDSVTLWWTNPNWSKTAPSFASCTFSGRTHDGQYKFISDTYGWTFLLDVEGMTVTTPQGKTYPVFNESGWLKTNTLTENGVSSKLPEDIDDFLQELAQSQGMFDYNDIINYSPSRKDISNLRYLMTEYEDAFDDEDAQDIAKQVSKIIKGGELTESVNELAHEVAIAMQHLMNDIGRDPTADDFADDVVAEIEKGLPEEEIPTDPIKYRDWASAIMCEVSRQLNSLKESYNVQYYQIFSNPEKPTDNGRMIAQAGTEDEAKAKGDELVGKGSYLIKAVCDDGKVRDVDLHDYFNEDISNRSEPLNIYIDDLKNLGFNQLNTDDKILKFEAEPEYSVYTSVYLKAEKAGFTKSKITRDDHERVTYMKSKSLGELNIIETLGSTRILVVLIPKVKLESTSNNQLIEAVDDWSLSVYDENTLLKDNIWSVSDALEFIHDNGGNIIKKLENGEETIIWKDGKAVGGGFIGMDYDEDGSTIYANDGEDVPTHEAPARFNAAKWFYGEELSESFNQIIDLDMLASDVANLLDVDVLGEENWIEVFPTSDSRPISNSGYLLPLEITGPKDDLRKATFTSKGNVVDVKFRNGSEAKCYNADEIARFIAGEFGISLTESVCKEDLTMDEFFENKEDTFEYDDSVE